MVRCYRSRWRWAPICGRSATVRRFSAASVPRRSWAACWARCTACYASGCSARGRRSSGSTCRWRSSPSCWSSSVFRHTSTTPIAPRSMSWAARCWPSPWVCWSWACTAPTPRSLRYLSGPYRFSADPESRSWRSFSGNRGRRPGLSSPKAFVSGPSSRRWPHHWQPAPP
ncbi:Uncharacterised protein [Mycobacteroides abscessus subsp. massiliense]|nr:Uncharacterised protein [Mycobacteroides abscessus subsp. massiliense]